MSTVLFETRPLIFSHGGGRQTVAMGVLAAKGKIERPELIVMADTGREASSTWEYHKNHFAPFMIKHGLTVHIISHSLSSVDLYGRGGECLLPAYTENGRLPSFCSGEWKRNVVARFLLQRGFGIKRPLRMALGFSSEETKRIGKDRAKYRHGVFPLIDMKLSVLDCERIIEEAGLPKPPRSSCWCCPHRRNNEWRFLRDNYPEDFAAACALDNEIRQRDLRGGLWLHESRQPLESAPLTNNADACGKVRCDSGHCFV